MQVGETYDSDVTRDGEEVQNPRWRGNHATLTGAALFDNGCRSVKKYTGKSRATI